MITWKHISKLDYPFESRDLLVWYQGKVRFANLFRHASSPTWRWDVEVKQPGVGTLHAELELYQITWWSELNAPETGIPETQA